MQKISDRLWIAQRILQIYDVYMALSWAVKQKMLLLLLSGVTLGLTRSPRQYFGIIKNLPKEWKHIDQRALKRAVRSFYNERIVDYIERTDDSVEIILTEKGKRRAFRYKIDELKIQKPVKWDKKWRIVIFDIPEKTKRGREALRMKLRELGFKELQKSVFIHPFECKDEIDFITEVFNLRRHVKYIRSEFVTNEEELKLFFKLN